MAAWCLCISHSRCWISKFFVLSAIFYALLFSLNYLSLHCKQPLSLFHNFLCMASFQLPFVFFNLYKYPFSHDNRDCGKWWMRRWVTFFLCLKSFLFSSSSSSIFSSFFCLFSSCCCLSSSFLRCWLYFHYINLFNFHRKILGNKLLFTWNFSKLSLPYTLLWVDCCHCCFSFCYCYC